MGNFELLDNLFQIAVLLCACCAAGFFALRHKSRSLLILSLAYACFAMGTTYYVLYLVSNFTRDYTRFNLYYAVDLTLTLSMAALLPLTLREVGDR